MRKLIAVLALVPIAAAAQTDPHSGEIIETICPYPPSAAHAEGATLLYYNGTPLGRIMDVRVLASSGNTELDKAAVECVRGWRFDPRGPVAVLTMTRHRINIGWAATPAGGKRIAIPHDCADFYPGAERKAGAQGTTKVRFTITITGAVASPDVAQSSGNANLDAAALSCVLGWKYRPAMKDGKPVAVPWTADVVWKADPGAAQN